MAIQGTGTPKGDPIEAIALGNFFKKNGKERIKPVKIGSVKTNIGHLESAAGVAGVIKVLLMMKNKSFVPSLHFRISNPKIDFPKFNFEVSTQTEPWETLSCKMACVNSFGFGGTNGHAIIKEYTQSSHVLSSEPTSCSSKIPFAITAENRESLQRSINHVLQHLSSGHWNLHELAFTSTVRRQFFKFRILSFPDSIRNLIEQMQNQLTSVDKVKPVSASKPNIVFVFCGVGTTYDGMCSGLLRRERIFRDTVIQIDKILKKFTSWSVYEHLLHKRKVEEPFISHLAIFSCQIALSELWKSWGILPNAVVGQSVGEIAAAFSAGSISLDCAVTIIYHRSQILSQTTKGSMAVVLNIDIHEIQNMCEQIGNISIAVYISKSACTLSGDSEAIKTLKSTLELKGHNGTMVKPLNVNCAYHSKFVESESHQIEKALQGICGENPKVKLVSTVTGKTAGDKDFISASYWRANVREPVRFFEGVAECELPSSTNIFVEIGPTPVLSAHFKSIFNSENYFCLPSMRKNSDTNVIYSTLSELFCKGIDPQFCQMFATKFRNALLPAYVPSKTKFLFESESRKFKRQGLSSNQSTHLFVKRLGNDLYRVSITPETTPFVYEHVVSGTILLPGAFYVEVALEIGTDKFKTTCNELSVSAKFVHPFYLTKNKPAVLEATVSASGKDKLKIELISGKDIISKSIVSLHDTKNDKEFLDIQKLKKICRKQKSSVEIYSTLKNLGFEYGDGIRILGDAVRNENQCVVMMELSERILEGVHRTNIHPAILDALLQTPGVMQSDNDKREFLPGGISNLLVHRYPEKDMIVVTTISSRNEKEDHYNLTLLNSRGAIIAEVRDFWITYMTSSLGHNLKYSLALQLLHNQLQLQNENTRELSRKVTVLCYTMSEFEKYEDIKGITNLSVLCIEHATGSDFERELSSAISTSDILVFLSNGKLTNISEEQDRVMEQSISNTQALLDVCKILVGQEKHLPLLVMTYCTQPLGENCNEHTVNMFGAELWGFTRCIQKENVYLQHPLSIQLIDIHPLVKPLSLSTILSVIGQLQSTSSISEYPELIICGNSIYSCEFQIKKSHDRSAYRQIEADKQCNLEFRAIGNHMTDILIFQRNENLLQKTPKTESVKIHSFSVHEETIYPSTPVQDESNSTSSKNIIKEGKNILSFEVIGCINSSAEQNDRSQPSLIGCYPVSVSSIQQIPKSCICSLQEIPFCTPGLLITCVLLDALLKFTDQNDGVTIIIEDEKSREFHILKHLLRDKVNLVDWMEVGSMVSTECPTAVILTYLTVPELTNVIEKMENLTSIITHNFLMDVEMRRFLLEQASFIDLKIVEEDVCLSKTYLARNMPQIFNLMKEQKSNFATYSRLQSSLFHCESVPVDRLISLAKNKMIVTKEAFFRKNACYVIIGGTTGFGWEVANFLACNEAGFIVSISRRKPENSKMTDMQNLEKEHGCTFTAVQADVTKIEELQAAFLTISQTIKRPIKGIFQGAGILNDSLFMNVSHESLLSVMLPKVLGTWNLHLISLKHDLEYFVMHSSITSVLGNPGQCNYAAGNSFMDTLAHLRRKSGLCAQSINWGPLSVGMAKESKVDEILKKAGYLPLEKEERISCFMDMCQHDHAQVTYGNFNWKIIEKDLLSLPNLRNKFRDILSGVIPYHKVKTKSDSDQPKDNFESIFVGIPKSEWKQRVIELVQNTTSEVFALDITQISVDTQFTDLHIDSMLAMTFSNTIEEQTNHRLPVVYLLSDEASINSVSDMIIEKECADNTNSLQIESVDPGENMNNDKDQFLDGAMTPFEKMSYEVQLKHPNDTSLFIFVDIEVPHNLANPDIWRTILKTLHERFPVLRTLYLPNTDKTRYGVKKETIHQENIVVDFNEVSVAALNHETRFPENLHQYSFDPERNLPLRTFYAYDGSQCILRFVFNHICIDMTSIWILLKELEPIENPPLRANHDITTLLERKLNKERNKLEKFWRNEIPEESLNMSLSSEDIRLSPDHVKFIKLQIEPSKILKLRDLLEEQACTLFHFVVTTYQLLLQKELQCQRSVTMTTVDMRIHFRELKEAVCKFTNRIPLYLEVDDPHASVKDILRESSARIVRCIENSLLPFDEITKFVPDSSSKNFRHQVVMDDMTQSRFLTSSEKYPIKFKRVISGNHYNETILYVWHDILMNDVSFELAYSTKALTDSYAHDLFRKLINSIDRVLDDQQLTVNGMFEKRKDNLKETCHPVTSPAYPMSSSIQSICGIESETSAEGIIIKELMLKQTSRGWDHQVIVQIENNGHNWLKWGSSPNKMSRCIPFSQITNVQACELTNNFALIVETQQRRFIFKSNQKETVRRVASIVIGNGLDKEHHKKLKE